MGFPSSYSLALDTLSPDAGSPVNVESLAKRQRLHEHIESVSTSVNTLPRISHHSIPFRRLFRPTELSTPPYDRKHIYIESQ